MTRIPFNDRWSVQNLDGGVVVPVTLPHDAMIGEPRTRAAASGGHGGYFPGGRYLYSRTWDAPADAGEGHVGLVFEGVYGRTTVRVNGTVVGRSISGYREFTVPLDSVLVPGEPNLIEVEVDNSRLPDSRWYTGSGIYRRVWLDRTPRTRLAADGVGIHTRQVGAPTLLEVTVDVETTDPARLDVTVTVADGDDIVAQVEAPVAGPRTTLELAIPEAKPWSHRSPHRYRTVVELRCDGVVLDAQEHLIGLRTVEVDPEHGLRVNGERVLLQGACVHHDSGILGAATFRAAEHRRARILKENGFNAIRSSHNPISRDLLDACDELGLYVVDELTDVWFGAKTAHDAAPDFDQVWRDDARAMVATDRLHPSVIMYSIGNEIAETATARGVQVAAELSAFLRGLDPHRPVTVAVNFLLNLMATRGKSLFDTSEHVADEDKPTGSGVTSTMANVLANKIGRVMQTVARLPQADRATRDVFTTVDVAGYNYAWGRYRADAKRYPRRVVLGTESMPGDIAKIWPIVADQPNVIGDFMWTGWDYLGEAGLGTWSYGSAPAAAIREYPQLLAGCGAIDITGIPGAPALLARATWGELDAPQIAVRPLDHSGETVRRTAWRSTDAVQSWSWRGCEGRTAEIEVYSADEEVEVVLNGRSLGRKPAGARRGFRTRYRARYQPGEIEVIGYRAGAETGRSALRSAGDPQVRVVPETNRLVADGQDLAYLRVELADEHGVVDSLAADDVTVEVSGPGSLAAVGSAAPATEESFTDAHHSTWYGRALVVVRAGDEPGDMTVTVTSRRHGTRSVDLRVDPLGSRSEHPRPLSTEGV